MPPIYFCFIFLSFLMGYKTHTFYTLYVKHIHSNRSGEDWKAYVKTGCLTSNGRLNHRTDKKNPELIKKDYKNLKHFYVKYCNI